MTASFPTMQRNHHSAACTCSFSPVVITGESYVFVISCLIGPGIQNDKLFTRQSRADAAYGITGGYCLYCAAADQPVRCKFVDIANFLKDILFRNRTMCLGHNCYAIISTNKIMC